MDQLFSRQESEPSVPGPDPVPAEECVGPTPMSNTTGQDTGPTQERDRVLPTKEQESSTPVGSPTTKLFHTHLIISELVLPQLSDRTHDNDSFLCRVTDYTMEFWTLAADRGWNQEVLFDTFIEGLSDPSRINSPHSTSLQTWTLSSA